MDLKNTHSVTKTEISVFGRQALDAERRRYPSLADKVLKECWVWSDIDDNVTSGGGPERCRGKNNDPRTRRNESGTQQGNGFGKNVERSLIKQYFSSTTLSHVAYDTPALLSLIVLSQWRSFICRARR